MLRRTIVIIAALTAIISAAPGQSFDTGLLWKVSGEDLEKSSYLFGTFHLLCPEQMVLGDNVSEALGSCDRLVLELDFDDPRVLVTAQQGMVLPEGTTARDYLSDEEYDLVSGFFSDVLGYPFEPVSVVKPFFLASLVTVYFLGCQPESLEMKLSGMAQHAGMEVRGLETVAEQLKMIDDIPLEDQKEMLLECLEDADVMEEMTARLVNTYLEGDLPGLQDIIDEFMSDRYASLNEDLLLSRNRAWIPVVESMIIESSSFIAVGAGHLPGEGGLISLLRKSGLRVEPVK
jgi:uncharacterized protein YbaP (TraB family)